MKKRLPSGQAQLILQRPLSTFLLSKSRHISAFFSCEAVPWGILSRRPDHRIVQPLPCCEVFGQRQQPGVPGLIAIPQPLDSVGIIDRDDRTPRGARGVNFVIIFPHDFEAFGARFSIFVHFRDRFPHGLVSEPSAGTPVGPRRRASMIDDQTGQREP